MVNEYMVKQTMKVFTEIATKLINPSFRFPGGGAAIRTVRTSLERLERKHGVLTRERVVDYLVCSAYPFKNRGKEWKINQVFGQKSLDRFDSDRGRRYYEDQWLAKENITRATLLALIPDQSHHPQAQYIFMPMEESTKRRMLNSEAGYVICQSSTLGWSPGSESCGLCQYVAECKIETQKKFPEIFRLREEYVSKK